MSSKVVVGDVWVEEDYIWFWGWNYNGLFRIKKKNYNLEWVTSFPLEPLIKRTVFSRIIKNKDSMILPSRDGELRVGIYNCVKSEWRVIKFPENILNERRKEFGAYFNKCIVYGKYVYVIGLRLPLIARINIEDFSVEHIIGWKKEVNIDINNLPSDEFFFWDGIVVNDMAYIPIGFTNAVLELDLKTAECNIAHIPTAVKAFGRGAVIDGKLWLTGHHEPIIVIYDLQDKSVTEICMEHCSGDINTFFYGPIDCGDKVLVFAARAIHSYWIDKNTMQVRICKELDKNTTEGLYTHANVFLAKIDREIHYWSVEERLWYVLNIDTCEKRIINTELPEAFEKELHKKKFNRPIVEKEDYILQDYISDCQGRWIDREYYSSKSVEIIFADADKV